MPVQKRRDCFFTTIAPSKVTVRMSATQNVNVKYLTPKANEVEKLQSGSRACLRCIALLFR